MSLPVPPPLDVQGAFSADDYARISSVISPRGLLWRDEPGDVRSSFYLAVGDVLNAVDQRGQAVLAGSLPGAVAPTLPEWEATLGLPDPCLGAAPAFEERAAQVRARFVGVGGLSRGRYVQFAAELGFEISIENYAWFRVGQSTVDSPVAGDEWRFVLGVRVLSQTTTISTDALMCELNAIRPAETTFILLN